MESAGSSTLKPSLAKKVLFLYPHSVIQEQMINILIQAEYEVALVTSHEKALRLLERFKSSILFCNVDDTHLSAEEWGEFIKGIVDNSAQTDARVGVMTYNPDPTLAQKYLMDIGVTCGYIGLKLGLADSTKILLKTLDANEAKGGRRFVRVKGPHGKSIISINHNGRMLKGNIIDLSSAGIACTFEEQLKAKVGSELEDVQMQLWGAIVRATLSLMGMRDQEGVGMVYVFMFESFAAREAKGKLYTFIRKSLQLEIDSI